jgi:CspA family cold shock protein
MAEGKQKVIKGCVGTVKWWENSKGFGFISPRHSGTDVFVHTSKINGAGYQFLTVGETVQFDVVEIDKGPVAENVIRVKENPPS